MSNVSRRRFMQSGAAGAAAASIAGLPTGAAAQETSPEKKGAPPPSAQERAAETQAPPVAAGHVGRSGSDYMVDVIKQMDIDYVAANPGSTFRGLHESIINYGGNTKPELLTCLHEEIAVAMSHGYAKASGKTMAVLLHGVVGMAHGAMAIYNAWCDRVPVMMFSGAQLDVTGRRGRTAWNHASQDAAAILRDFTKWDAQPVSLTYFGESATRAYTLATTPPCAPVVVMADLELQEMAIEGADPVLPRLNRPILPVADAGSLSEIADLLAKAENPVIIADMMARNQHGVDQLVELAETLQAAIVDRLGRMNFPSRHPLNQSFDARRQVAHADVILGLEVWDLWGSLYQIVDLPNPPTKRMANPNAKIVSISTNDLHVRANHQDFQRYQPVDIDIVADAQESLPLLNEAVKRALASSGASARQARGGRLAENRRRIFERDRATAALGWNASPISVARMCMELWDQLKDENWALVSDNGFKAEWPHHLWDLTKYHHYNGESGGQGQGYGLPASIGAALAHREHGRIVVNLQGDGDMLYCPTALWTAAHHKIPLLTMVHNNGGYHQEVMHIQRMAGIRSRGVDRAYIGSKFDDPPISFSGLARDLGVWSAGPISDPAQLGPAIRRALAVVKGGEPALIDVISQPR